MKTTLALIAALSALGVSAQTTFKCVDPQGKTHIGDTPPAACGPNATVQELSKGGTVKRVIAPPPTAEELRQKELEAAKKVEDDKRAAEQKRKDEALMQTFSSEKEFDVVRDRQIEPLNRNIRVAKERLAAIDKREKEVAEELEFYKAGKSGKSGKSKGAEAPRGLLDEMERAKEEREKINKSIAGAEKEIGEIRAKFDVDKKRWVALRAGQKAEAKAAVTPVIEKKK